MIHKGISGGCSILPPAREGPRDKSQIDLNLTFAKPAGVLYGAVGLGSVKVA